MTRKAYQAGRIYVGRLPAGADLVAALTKIANEESIKVGTVTVHGFLRCASIVRMDPATQTPVPVPVTGPLEIAALGGTISQFKGRSMPRLNGMLIGPDGVPVGGAVGLGTIVHACEVVLHELLGGVLSRDFDTETGLPLWKDQSLLIDPTA